MSAGFDPWAYAVPLPNGCQQMTELSQAAASEDWQAGKIDMPDYLQVINMVNNQRTRCPSDMTPWLIVGGLVLGYIVLKGKKKR